LRNALEHGQVSRATISVTSEEGGLTLAIRDNGKGMDARTASAGSGLSIMHHRADLIGATFRIESEEGRGTSVICSLPHRAKAPPSASRAAATS
ncbi:MAG: sensor histidine kinase, partial [Planctomycetes bacterium]|nr:sensor histidine kinase [Planctomycetota bacterium]